MRIHAAHARNPYDEASLDSHNTRDTHDEGDIAPSAIPPRGTTGCSSSPRTGKVGEDGRKGGRGREEGWEGTGGRIGGDGRKDWRGREERWERTGGKGRGRERTGGRARRGREEGGGSDQGGQIQYSTSSGNPSLQVGSKSISHGSYERYVGPYYRTYDTLQCVRHPNYNTYGAY